MSWSANQRAALSPGVDRQLLAEEQRRIAQYAWEGSFFLIALAACIAVIARALRAEARVIEEQESFLALVSHQFKTPLASLQLSLETMAMRPLSPEHLRALIERMLADLARMESMVTQILESMRLDRGRIDLRSEPVELGGAVARVIAGFEERAAKDRITVSADIERGLQVLADPLALDVVLRNVLENALAAVAPVGGGNVDFPRPRSGRRSRARGARQRRRFQPGGRRTPLPEIHPPAPRRRRQPLRHGARALHRPRLMQLAGGRVSAQSAGAGQGATFVLTWPAGEASETGSPAATATVEPLARAPARREQS